MMPRAAITAVCGTGNTRSAQMRAIPTAHAQPSYCRSVRTASLASGIVAQEASTSDRTPITIRPDLTWASQRVGPALQGSALVRPLQPAAHAGLVVPIGVAEPPLQIRLLARDDAVADRDCQRQGEDQCPRTSCGYADAARRWRRHDTDRGGPKGGEQGRGDHRSDARSGPVLLQDTGP